MKAAGLIVPVLIAGGSPATAQSFDDVRLTEGKLELRYNWLFGHSAFQHYRIENLTNRALRVDIECGFETENGYADGSGDVLTIPARQSVEGAVGGGSVSGRIERAGCTLASVSLP